MKGIIIGSSGLVGKELLHQLCDNPAFDAITILVRRPSGIKHPKVKEVVIDFEHLDNYKEHIKGDVVFSCLGTTRSQSPDLKTYYKIDYEYPVKIAWIATENKVKQFHIISAVGAKEKSSNSYLKVKGETEVNISVIKFDSTHFYRPSILIGKRKEPRTMEQIGVAAMKVVNPFLFGGAKKYRSIAAADVAKAMIAQSLKHLEGTFYYESDKIQEIADQL
ncbi:NAD(P)H-binding protein [Taibaiella lutea]|uniref:NAD(P)H-binding protein n=1 Tax=Taibaiella lutea TaxID=2608001 RepID=A0A5M6CPL7_9BACT|nr:NAD(P)H-binding protein [Taibaiella lutea]KAA5537228.1 NAD(P)H-binding protein [Taibaiella lutea]